MKPSSLSVILPNYNHGHLLPRCLDALISQTLQANEIIIVDDGSTDHSVQIIERYCKRHPFIRFFRNERNEGVIFTVNRAVDLAQFDYLFLAPADDQSQPTLFEKSLNLLREHPEAAFCCTISDFRDVSTGMNWHTGVGIADRACYLSPAQLVALGRKGRLHIAPNTAVIRRDAFIQAGKFVPELKWHTDWLAFYTAAFRHGICFVPEPLAIFYVLPDSYYTRGSKDKDAHCQVLKQLLELLRSPPYQDVVSCVRDSGELYLFGWPMLRLMLSNSPYRHFLTPVFLRKNLWHIFKLEMKKITPAFLGNLYFRLAGYRARPTRPSS